MNRTCVVVGIRALKNTASLAYCSAGLLLLVPTVVVAGEKDKRDPAGIEFFEKKIRPVLVEQCYRCHSAQAAKLKGNLRLDSKAAMLKGGDNGPSLVPGQPGKSLLVKALKYVDDLQMPPKGQLPAAVIADFEKWIASGAPDPRDGNQVAAKQFDWAEARQTWAFQRPVQHALPAIKNKAWPKKDIDFFLLAEMEKRGLEPVGPAAKRDLIRRATFDLTGLPPTPEEIDAFDRDASPAAFARVVDRLLSSPHYGERWGRYWLDLARFADDKALAMSQPYPHAHRYRDWVIRAFNKDIPYDRFVKLQLAGDLLTEPGEDNFVRLAGLGFQGLGAEYHKGNFAAQVMADELDDRVDTLSRALLGLTVACARCHDHKYDPIPTLDYYSLAAAYQGSTLSIMPLATPAETARLAAWDKKAKQLDADLTAWLRSQAATNSKQAVSDVGNYLLAAWKVRTLREQGKSPDEATLIVAVQDKLQPYFLGRFVKYLGSAGAAKDPVLQPWLTAARAAQVKANADVPGRLDKAAEELRRQVAMELKRPGDPRKSPLLKTLWLDANAPFALTEKDAHAVLPDKDRQQYQAFRKEIENHKNSAPPAPLLIHGVKGGGQAMRVHIRGNVERLGDPAPPGFLRILQAPGRGAPSPGAGQFTRLELANAIATAENPLTARVFVNRVWQNHFGRGIVATASNFGKLGDRPTHPELLDTLAVRFVEAGWSVKWLHREMMLSATYQMSSVHQASNLARDAENRYLWRMPARRLDFEAWRDALLAVSGRLDPTLGGPSFDLTDAKSKSVRRSIYAKVSRALPNSMLTMFDFPDANVSSDRRNVTTVPQQQLFVLNSEFMSDCARALAARLEKSARDDDRRIELAYRLAYGRSPGKEEIQISRDFLRGATTHGRLTPWEQYSQAILAANEFAWVD